MIELSRTKKDKRVFGVLGDSNLSADTDFGRTARAGRARAQLCTTSGRPRELNPRRMAAPRGYGRAPPAPARRRRLAMAL